MSVLEDKEKELVRMIQEAEKNGDSKKANKLYRELYRLYDEISKASNF